MVQTGHAMGLGWELLSSTMVPIPELLVSVTMELRPASRLSWTDNDVLLDSFALKTTWSVYTILIKC